MFIMYRKRGGRKTAHTCANRNRYIAVRRSNNERLEMALSAPLVACRAARRVGFDMKSDRLRYRNRSP